jgi:hypothetical protein
MGGDNSKIQESFFSTLQKYCDDNDISLVREEPKNFHFGCVTIIGSGTAGYIIDLFEYILKEIHLTKENSFIYIRDTNILSEKFILFSKEYHLETKKRKNVVDYIRNIIHDISIKINNIHIYTHIHTYTHIYTYIHTYQ